MSITATAKSTHAHPHRSEDAAPDVSIPCCQRGTAPTAAPRRGPADTGGASGRAKNSPSPDAVAVDTPDAGTPSAVDRIDESAAVARPKAASLASMSASSRRASLPRPSHEVAIRAATGTGARPANTAGRGRRGRAKRGGRWGQKKKKKRGRGERGPAAGPECESPGGQSMLAWPGNQTLVYLLYLKLVQDGRSISRFWLSYEITTLKSNNNYEPCTPILLAMRIQTHFAGHAWSVLPSLSSIRSGYSAGVCD